MIEECPVSLESVTLCIIAWLITSGNVLHNGTACNIQQTLPKPNVKSFEGTGFLYSKECIKYFKHKFHNLKNLVIKDAWNGLMKEEVIPQIVLSSFFRFIERIPKFKLAGALKDSKVIDERTGEYNFFNLTNKLIEHPTRILGTKYAKYNMVLTFADQPHEIKIPKVSVVDRVTVQNYKDDDWKEWASNLNNEKDTLYLNIYFGHTLNLCIRHADILKNMGPQIRQLQFNPNQFIVRYYDTNAALGIFDVSTRKFNIMNTSSQIIQACKNLHTLSFKNLAFKSCEERVMCQNTALKKLGFDSVFLFYKKVLPRLWDWLVSLEELVFKDTIFTDWYESSNKNHVEINMRKTYFRHISWITRNNIACKNPYTTFSLKVHDIEMAGDAKYYIGDGISDVREASEEEYEVSVYTIECISFHIICKQLQSFSTTLDNGRLQQSFEIA